MTTVQTIDLNDLIFVGAWVWIVVGRVGFCPLPNKLYFKSLVFNILNDLFII